MWHSRSKNTVHELSIAQNILDIVHQSVEPKDLDDVRFIRLRIGALSGVVADSLEFCFTAIVAETPLVRARLAIEHIPFRVRCESCAREFENDIGYVVCPDCGGVRTQVLSGRELQVVEIELEDHTKGAP